MQESHIFGTVCDDKVCLHVCALPMLWLEELEKQSTLFF